MEFESTTVDGCFVASLKQIGDERGFFARQWCADELGAIGAANSVAQINTSYCVDAGLIRGLHWQEPPVGEAKFMRCVNGAIFDVCADVRPDSPTFGKWFGVELTPQNRLALVIPEGCAHAYQSLMPDSEVIYLTNTPYTPGAEKGLRYDDPFFNIDWPITDGIMLSEKDENWPPFSA